MNERPRSGCAATRPGGTMAKLTFEITMSLDGFVAGPDPSYEEPLGAGGDRLHEWILGLRSWRERHGLSGGATGPDDELVEESLAKHRGGHHGQADVQRRRGAVG